MYKPVMTAAHQSTPHHIVYSPKGPVKTCKLWKLFSFQAEKPSKPCCQVAFAVFAMLKLSSCQFEGNRCLQFVVKKDGFILDKRSLLQFLKHIARKKHDLREMHLC